MSRHKKDAIILLALAPIFIFLLINFAARKGRSNTRDVFDSEEENLPISADGGHDNDDPDLGKKLREEQLALQQTYLLHGFSRDPFVRADKVGQAVTLRLNGILFSQGGRAIINGKIVAEGSVISGFTVDRIEPEEVILEKNNRKYSLTIEKAIRTSIPNPEN